MNDYQEPTGAIALREPSAVAIASPLVTPAEAKAKMEAYFALCESILTRDDYQEFRERGETKRFKKKSAVKKLQTFFGVTVSVRDVVRDDLGDGNFGFRCVAIATEPGGRSVESTGGCTTFEDRFTPKRYEKTRDRDEEPMDRYLERCRKAKARAYHDVMSTAETRATNRAVMNLIGVGGGEVTADEISREDAPRVVEKSAPKPKFDVHEWVAKAAAKSMIAANLPQDQALIAFKNAAKAAGVEWTPKGVIEWVDSFVPAAEVVVVPMATPEQRRKAMALHNELGHDTETRHAYYELKYAVRSFNDLTRDQASEVINMLTVQVENLGSQADDEEFL